MGEKLNLSERGKKSMCKTFGSENEVSKNLLFLSLFMNWSWEKRVWTVTFFEPKVLKSELGKYEIFEIVT